MASPLMVPFQHQDDPDLVKKRRLSLLSLGANSTTLPEGYVQSCEASSCRESLLRLHTVTHRARSARVSLTDARQ